MSSLSDFYTKTAIKNAPKHTGKLPLSDEEARMPVPSETLYTNDPYVVPNTIAETIQYRHSDTPLNKVFFSQTNIDNLQERIRNTVLIMSNGDFSISPQNETDLRLIMRSYYLQYAENNPQRVAKELDDLNRRTIDYASNRIMVEIYAYKRYRKDILDFPDPIANPVNVDIYGTRTGELKSFF
jgi:hypothetical protein